jgi:hypothetical protein
VLAYDELEQEQLQQDDATLLEEDRLQAAVRAARYQQALHRYHSRKVHARSLEEGDLVLRRVQSAKNSNKLTPKWEGPYRVIRVTRPGAVHLETEDGIPVSNSWNIEHLRKFTHEARLPGHPATPFCTSLADKAYNPMYKAKRRPCAQLNKFKYVQFLLISMFIYMHACPGYYTTFVSSKY